jgi:hypothetical protein
MSGGESVDGAVPVSAALAKPAVVAVPVHRVTDPRAKCTPEQSRLAEHLAATALSEWIVGPPEAGQEALQDGTPVRDPFFDLP